MLLHITLIFFVMTATSLMHALALLQLSGSDQHTANMIEKGEETCGYRLISARGKASVGLHGPESEFKTVVVSAVLIISADTHARAHTHTHTHTTKKEGSAQLRSSLASFDRPGLPPGVGLNSVSAVPHRGSPPRDTLGDTGV